MLVVLQGHLLALAEPGHEQGHGGAVILFAQQRLDNDGEGFGRMEVFELGAPEGEVGGGFAALAPLGQRSGHVLRRRQCLAAVHLRHVADLDRGEAVPPLGEALHLFQELGWLGQGAGRRAVADDAGIEREQPAGDLDQIIDALIADAVFEGGETGILGLKAEDVPRIDQRAASNAAAEEVFHFGQELGGRRHVAALEQQLTRREPPVHLGEHARRAHRDLGGLSAAGLGIADLSEEQGELALLQLQGPLPGHVVVQALADAAERLPRALRVVAQALRLRAGAAVEQVGVEGFAVLGDARHQLRQRHGRIVRLGPAAADAGAHEDRAGQDGRGFPHPLRPRRRLVPVYLRDKRIEHDLTDDVAPVAPLVVDEVRIPFAEAVVRPFLGGVVEVVGANVEGQFVEQVRIEAGVL